MYKSFDINIFENIFKNYEHKKPINYNLFATGFCI